MSTSRRRQIHAPATLGERAADLITTFVGSWLLVGIHATWFFVWIVLLRIEPFPFGLLTLLVSLEAIFLSTFVMMSQNRQAQKDRARDDLEAAEVEQLVSMNRTQLELLHQQCELLVVLHQVLAVKDDNKDEQTT